MTVEHFRTPHHPTRRPGGGAVALALALLAALAIAWSAPAQEIEKPVRPVAILEIVGPIGPATADHVMRGLEEAAERRASAVVLRIDTPGGLDTSMREIIEALLNAPMPVIGYVSPAGARAASAGTFILYASHVAAMAPATNLGAATPVAIGGGTPLPGQQPQQPEEKKDGEEGEDAEPTQTASEKKALNDAVAYIRGLAQMRGRNADWAEEAVREAASLPAEEALAAGVIDLIAPSIPKLLDAVDGREVDVLGETRTLQTAGASTFRIETDWRTEFLAVITNPTLAYILLLIGIYGLVFEFWNPGFTGPGVIGAICLVLALFALNQLPVNYAGFGLILLGIGFIVAETFMPSFGLLGMGGVVAFVLGSIMLIDTDVPGFQVSRPVIAAVGGTSAAAFLGVLMMLGRSRRRPVVSGQEEMIGIAGTVIDWTQGKGRVRAHGEVWAATGPQALSEGDLVRVAGLDGLTLAVVEAGEGDKEE